MNYREACEFFYKWGNVGRSVEELILTKPSEAQLHLACTIAMRKGANIQDIEEAKQAILKG